MTDQLPAQSSDVAVPAKRLRIPLFFVCWTLLALGATWWMIHAAGREHLPSEMLFDNSQDAQLSVGSQIRRWLRIADLSFRGAYPWILLAPYVVWLASRFLVERGRLRISLPVHIFACALFALTCSTLTTHLTEKRNLVVVVSEHREGKMLPHDFLTNVPFSTFHGGKDERITINSYTSQMGEVRTKVLVTAGSGAAPVSEPMPLLGSNAEPSLNQTEWLRRLGVEPNPAALGKSTDTRFFSSLRYDSGLFSNLLNVLAYGSLAGISHAVHFYRRSRERERRAMLLESHLTRARLHTLQAQLQPHFLFNALNAVSTLLRRDARAAQEALTSFSELLRLALSQSEKQQVSLREDLLFLERYVQIQQTRLGDRLRFEQQVSSAALDCLVPTLFLQPLVENAIRHGIELSATPGWVRVTAEPSGDRLRFSVEDNGVGLANAEQQNRTGIGLSNLRARLEALYGQEQKVEVISRAEGGVEVQLEIPLRYAAPNGDLTS